MTTPTDPSPTPVSSPAPQADDLSGTARALGWRVGVPAIVAATLPMAGGFTFIAVALSLKEWMDRHGSTATLGFVAFFALTTGLALMPTYALSFGAGVFFGWAVGGALAVGGAVLGAVIGYAVWGLMARERVMSVIDANPKARVVRDALVERSAWRTFTLVSLIRVPPNSPFALTNLVMSSVRVHPAVYVLGTAIGMAPRTVLAAFIGSATGSVADVGTSQGPWKIVGIVAAVVAFGAVFWLVSLWAKDALRRELCSA